MIFRKTKQQNRAHHTEDGEVGRCEWLEWLGKLVMEVWNHKPLVILSKQFELATICLPPFHLFYLTNSLSLSQTHTHTHTHTLSLSLSLSLSLFPNWLQNAPCLPSDQTPSKLLWPMFPKSFHPQAAQSNGQKGCTFWGKQTHKTKYE